MSAWSVHNVANASSGSRGSAERRLGNVCVLTGVVVAVVHVHLLVVGKAEWLRCGAGVTSGTHCKRVNNQKVQVHSGRERNVTSNNNVGHTATGVVSGVPPSRRLGKAWVSVYVVQNQVGVCVLREVVRRRH